VRTVDLNRDGRPDLLVHDEAGGSCRAVDLNFDGHIDLVRHRDAAGGLIREEADTDFDGRLDVAAHYGGGGSLLREEFDANWDGAIDLWVVFHSPCAFLDNLPPSTCVRECGVPWCQPRRLPPTAEELEYMSYGDSDREADSEPAAPTVETVALYRDADADGVWDVAEVLQGSSPLCVALNTGAVGDTPDTVRPESVEMYKPAIPGASQPDLDYVRQDYLDLAGDPIVRCEDDQGALFPCPALCTP
jgi:hypothetical protein